MFSSMLFHFSMFLLLINSSIQMMFESNIGKTLNHINGSLNLIANLIKNSENQMLRQIDVDCQKKHLDARNRQFVIDKLGTLKTCLNTEYEQINRSLNLIANLIKNSENQLQRQIDVDCQKKHLDARNRQLVVEHHSKLGTLKTCLNTEYEQINKTESENSVERCNFLVMYTLY
ncbi:hypothetical protein KSF78_0008522 [Schistosoma japonicum]|nr:hypothetical protein KSF78_0008522 [Schistosoma japonicum]